MEKITKQAKEMAEKNGLDEEINQAYINIVGEKYATAEECEEAYSGRHDSNEDFVQELLEGTGTLPKDLPCYIHIDWKGTARDIMMDYSEENGYYFRNL
jgi:antirestriction protein